MGFGWRGASKDPFEVGGRRSRRSREAAQSAERLGFGRLQWHVAFSVWNAGHSSCHSAKPSSPWHVHPGSLLTLPSQHTILPARQPQMPL